MPHLNECLGLAYKYKNINPTKNLEMTYIDKHIVETYADLFEGLS